MPTGAAILARGRCFTFAVVADRLCATVLWGAPEATDAEALVAAWRRPHCSGVHACLFDARAITAVAPAAFAVVQRYQETDGDRLAGHLSKKAVVFAPSQAGAVVAGFDLLMRSAFPTEAFADRAAALAWLEVADLAPALTALVADESGAEPVAALRRWLATAALAGLDLPTAAAALALSTRSLQRRLAEADTTFDRERVRAQLARAQELMRTTTRSLSDIAIAVGCASLPSFSAMFRRELGLAPSAWRARLAG